MCRRQDNKAAGCRLGFSKVNDLSVKGVGIAALRTNDSTQRILSYCPWEKYIPHISYLHIFILYNFKISNKDL